MRTLWFGIAAATSAAVVGGCANWGWFGGGSDHDRPFATVGEQADFGATIFSNRCATCHGESGQGTRRAPMLIGADALPRDPRPDAKMRTMAFHTAADVADFVTHNMPPTAASRASMTDRDYWGVLAYVLSANGVTPANVVGPDNAGEITLHP